MPALPPPSSASPRPYMCPMADCGKTFRRRSALNEHTATHTGVKAFVCPVGTCLQSFTTSGNLSRHKRVRHPWLDKPIECLVTDCGCKFPSEAKLERHMAMVHFGESEHTCQVRHCGRAFCSAGNLRRHMKQQHSDEGRRSLDNTTRPAKLESFSPIDVRDHSEFYRESLPWGFHHHDSSDQDEEADLLDVLSCLFD